MKKVVATTMATLLFGLSFPVTTFALPNNTEELESKIVEDFNVKKFNGRIIDRDPNFRLASVNNNQMPAVINSNDVGGVKPDGYVSVNYKVDSSMGKFKIGGHDIPEFELTYFVDPKVGVQLSEVSSVSPLVTDTSKYKLDEKNPWIIEPNSTNMQSEVKGDITLTANITKITTGTPNPGPSIADRIKSDKLHPVDISVWENDEINWKDGVKLDTSVNESYLRRAFDEAKFEGDGRASNLQAPSGSQGKIVVTFKDKSFIEVKDQKLYVFPHVTASTYANVPKDAVTTTFFLGEGSKVKSGLNEQVGDAEHHIPFQTFKIKPGTNIYDFHLPTNKNIFDNISAMPADDSYSDLKWEPENYIVSENNKSFTARAIKSYKVKFEFKAYDSDKGNEEINSLPQELMDKMPKDLKVKKGDSFEATKPENFVETIKDKAGEVIKVYEWTFAGWNPTKFLKVEKDEKISGTWKRKQATSAKPTADKVSEGDKVIKGTGISGSIIKIYLGEKEILEAKVSDTGNWEAKLDRGLNKDEKVIITQVEKGKKDSDKVESRVVEKNKPNPNPNPNPKPNPKPDQKPNQKQSPNKRPRTGNIFPKLKNRDYNKNSIEVKTYLAKSKINDNKNKGVRHIINVLSGEYEFVKDGVSQKKRMDVVPVIKNDRLMLPLRSLAEMIGARVEWDSQTSIATFTNNGLVAKIQIDGDEILLSNGKVIKMDSKPLNINGRILVSISNVGNVFGLTNGNTKDGIDQDIEWDDANKTVTINLKK
ncbi:stalk domain-containing protein [uncultured Peptoniphilus sp.]|uniref:stalk domain-containing protein n=1 Tax=uncultured Peptoniphilus sp. TaxID=254354 RepID=UPI002623E0EB|nr:stalk domain-containing protein [uncultured Peptoniphilus sp.]